jgi:hypothetical protein
MVSTVSLLQSRFAAADSIQPLDTNLCDILAFSMKTENGIPACILWADSPLSGLAM